MLSLTELESDRTHCSSAFSFIVFLFYILLSGPVRRVMSYIQLSCAKTTVSCLIVAVKAIWIFLYHFLGTSYRPSRHNLGHCHARPPIHTRRYLILRRYSIYIHEDWAIEHSGSSTMDGILTPVTAIKSALFIHSTCISHHWVIVNSGVFAG